MATIPSVPRRATQPLPSESDLGGDIPSVGAKGPVQVQGGIAEEGEARGGAALAQGGADLQAVGAKLGSMAEDMQQREDAITALYVSARHRAEVDRRMQDFLISGQLDPPSTAAFGKSLAELEAETLQKSGIRPQSVPNLLARLQGTTQGALSTMGTHAVKARTDMLMQQADQEILAPAVNAVAADPTSFQMVFQTVRQQIATLPLSADKRGEMEKYAMRSLGMSMFHSFADRGLLGAVDTDPDTVLSAREVVDYLAARGVFKPQDVIELNHKINALANSVGRGETATDEVFDPQVGRNVILTKQEIAQRRARGETVLAPQRQPQVVIQNPDNKQQNAFSNQVGTNEANELDTIRKDAKQAMGVKQSLAMARVGLSSGNFQTGIAAGFIRTLGAGAERFGISPELISAFGANPANADVITAVNRQLALYLNSRLSRSTNLSLQMSAESIPSLEKTPGGNAALIALLEAAADRDIELDRAATAYIKKHRDKTGYIEMNPPNGKGYRETLDAISEKPLITTELEKTIRNALAGRTETGEPLPSASRGALDTATKRAGKGKEKAPVLPPEAANHPDIQAAMQKGLKFQSHNDDGTLTFVSPKGKKLIWVIPQAAGPSLGAP